ncbi:aldo/keto reductase [Microbacterium sp. NPDC089320]|uniref:aldo/keto reductase n=1 Tax=Microbacterium sp. NPDC089320 TaxID=3155182 RepID=UPI00342E96BE
MSILPPSRRPLGRSGLSVSPLTLGAWKWGFSPFFPDEETGDEHDARIGALADAFLRGELPSTTLDTSNTYGDSRSEALIGEALRRVGGVPEGVVVQTKLDRHPETGDFSAARMRESLSESLDRLGLETLPLLYLHDPEHIGFEAAMAAGGPVDALVAMKEAGLVESIGISGGPVDMLDRFVRTDLFDALITHNRFTLVNRAADGLLDTAAEHGLGIMNAAPYGAGVLTGHPRYREMYAYGRIGRDTARAVALLDDLCTAAGVPLAALALQFSLRDPRIHSTIVGVSDVGRARELETLASFPIEQALRDEVEGALAGLLTTTDI